MNVKEYISSGIIESYVMGLASGAERQEFETNCAQYPEVAEARTVFELALEKQLLGDAASAPVFLKEQIEERLRSSATETTIAESEEERTPVGRIGIWRWIAAASLILMAASVYWAVTTDKKYRDLQAKNQTLETQVQQSTAQINEVRDDLDKLRNHPMKTAALKGGDNRAYAIVYWDTVSASRDVYLMINNLPQPASDKQYQLWALLNGRPIDLGMIEVRQQRLLYRMKNVQNAQAFAITLEPKGGSDQPTTAPIAVSSL
ncbi:MAG TPA: anti-sigma factor [Flavisolibacter sp.]|nr:anti-sigma factor [Flavisolibacter sp.]